MSAQHQNSSNCSLEDALIDLYLNVKIRKEDDINAMDKSKLLMERELLKKTPLLTIVDYIKTSMDILIDLKVDEKLEILKKQKENYIKEIPEDYENLLRKSESDIRQHIRIEHQLKLHSESLQTRIDELEKENEEMSSTIKNESKEKLPFSKRTTERKESQEIEVSLLRNEITNLKQIIKSYEDQNLKITEMERRLKTQNLQQEKELKSIEEKYKERFKLLSKKIRDYEDLLKLNTSTKSILTKNGTNNLEDDLDRGNLCNYTPNQSKVTLSKKSQSTTSREKVVDKNSVQKKIEQYRKVIEKKINDISRDKSFDKSGNTVDAEKSASSITYSKKEKTIDHSYRKNQSYLIEKLDKATQKLLSEYYCKSHARHASLEIKGKNPITINKNISTIKEMIFAHNWNFYFNNNNNNNTKTKSQTVKKKAQIDKSADNSNNNNPEIASSVIINQSAVPSFGNINKFPTNHNPTMKMSYINKGQDCSNRSKPGNTKENISKTKTHFRSGSSNFF